MMETPSGIPSGAAREVKVDGGSENMVVGDMTEEDDGRHAQGGRRKEECGRRNG